MMSQSEKQALIILLVIVLVLTVIDYLYSVPGNNAWKTGREIVRMKDYEDWRFECFKTDKNGKGLCRIFQRLTQNENDQVERVLTAVVVMVKRKLPEQETEISVPILRLITPMNVYLPAGVTVQFDKDKQYGTPYELCRPAGCIAERGLGKEILEKMHGEPTMFVAYQRVEKGSAAPLVLGISLKGFATAFQALAQESIQGQYIDQDNQQDE